MSEEKTKIAVESAFGEYLKKKGLRRTPERYVILDKVMGMNDHFHVETLHSLIEADSYHISLATVYNTMQLFVDFGIVRRHQFAGQPAQYERIADNALSNHHHLICRHCGKIKEVKDPVLTRMLNDKRYISFQPEYFSLYVYGVCSRCQRALRRSKK